MKPTILLVHGAWHTPEAHYAKFIRALEASGFDVAAPQLPSVNGARPPTATLWSDVDCIRAKAADLVEQGRTVLVVAHSYGGIVTTNAIDASLSLRERQAAGRQGGILALFYICAFLPNIGDTLLTLEADHPCKLVPRIAEDGTIECANPVEAFYTGVESEEAEALAANLVVQPADTFATATQATAWRYFDVTYVFCTLDGAIMYAAQKAMVRAVEDAGVKMRTETFEAGHSPFVSHIAETVDAVKRAWKASAGDVMISVD